MENTNSYAAFVAPRRDALLSAASLLSRRARWLRRVARNFRPKGPLIMSTITTKDSTEIYYRDYRRLLASFRD